MSAALMRLTSGHRLSLDSDYYIVHMKQQNISEEAREVSGICHVVVQRHLR